MIPISMPPYSYRRFSFTICKFNRSYMHHYSGQVNNENDLSADPSKTQAIAMTESLKSSPN